MLTVDTSSATPPYEQIRRLVIAQVRSGELTAGDGLPTVRSLAAELGLAPNTVARAYKELEHEGVVVTGGRRGTRVAGAEPSLGPEARRAAEEFLATMAELGVSPDAAVRLLRSLSAPSD